MNILASGVLLSAVLVHCSDASNTVKVVSPDSEGALDVSEALPMCVMEMGDFPFIEKYRVKRKGSYGAQERSVVVNSWTDLSTHDGVTENQLDAEDADDGNTHFATAVARSAKVVHQSNWNQLWKSMSSAQPIGYLLLRSRPSVLRTGMKRVANQMVDATTAVFGSMVYRLLLTDYGSATVLSKLDQYEDNAKSRVLEEIVHGHIEKPQNMLVAEVFSNAPKSLSKSGVEIATEHLKRYAQQSEATEIKRSMVQVNIDNANVIEFQSAMSTQSTDGREDDGDMSSKTLTTKALASKTVANWMADNSHNFDGFSLAFVDKTAAVNALTEFLVANHKLDASATVGSANYMRPQVITVALLNPTSQQFRIEDFQRRKAYFFKGLKVPTAMSPARVRRPSYVSFADSDSDEQQKLEEVDDDDTHSDGNGVDDTNGNAETDANNADDFSATNFPKVIPFGRQTKNNMPLPQPRAADNGDAVAGDDPNAKGNDNNGGKKKSDKSSKSGKNGPSMTTLTIVAVSVCGGVVVVAAAFKLWLRNRSKRNSGCRNSLELDEDDFGDSRLLETGANATTGKQPNAEANQRNRAASQRLSETVSDVRRRMSRFWSQSVSSGRNSHSSDYGLNGASKALMAANGKSKMDCGLSLDGRSSRFRATSVVEVAYPTTHSAVELVRVRNGRRTAASVGSTTVSRNSTELSDLQSMERSLAQSSVFDDEETEAVLVTTPLRGKRNTEEDISLVCATPRKNQANATSSKWAAISRKLSGLLSFHTRMQDASGETVADATEDGILVEELDGGNGDTNQREDELVASGFLAVKSAESKKAANDSKDTESMRTSVAELSTDFGFGLRKQVVCHKELMKDVIHTMHTENYSHELSVEDTADGSDEYSLEKVEYSLEARMQKSAEVVCVYDEVDNDAIAVSVGGAVHSVWDETKSEDEKEESAQRTESASFGDGNHMPTLRLSDTSEDPSFFDLPIR